MAVKRHSRQIGQVDVLATGSIATGQRIVFASLRKRLRFKKRDSIMQGWKQPTGDAMPQHTRPNVLLVVADQMRRDALGLNRPAFVHTPHLDQLAREGVNFTRAYSACPSCIAARASLMTGLRHETSPRIPRNSTTFRRSARSAPRSGGTVSWRNWPGGRKATSRTARFAPGGRPCPRRPGPASAERHRPVASRSS